MLRESQDESEQRGMTLPKIDTTRSRPVEPNPPIRFGLRTFLIAITVVGVVIGLLGRTWNRNPELVLAIFKFSPLIVVALQLTLVFRRRQIRQSFARHAPLLCFLLVLPSVQLARIDSLRLLPTKHLVEKRLTKDAEDWAVWKELQRRMLNQKLSSKEVDHLVETLIVKGKHSSKGYIYKNKSNPLGGPPHAIGKFPSPANTPLLQQSMFARNFVDIAVQRDLISDKNLIAIADQHYSLPTAKRLRLREGLEQVGLHFIDYGKNSFGCPLQLVWHVESVDLDGRVVEVQQGGNYPLGRIEEEFSVGESELNVHLVCGYVPLGSIGVAWHGVLDPKKWPKTLKEWKAKVTMPLRVYAADDEIVSLVADKVRDPSDFLKVQGVFFQAKSGNLPARLHVKTQAKPNPSVPVAMCFNIFLVTEDKRIEIGQYLAYHDVNGELIASCTSKALESPIDELPEKGDLVFVPSPRNKHLEQVTEVTEIWGKTIVIKDCEVKPMPRPNLAPPPPVVDPNA